MKFTRLMSAAFMALFLASCGQEEKPKVIYKEEATEKPNAAEDKPQVEEDFRIADLPILIGESNYMIHPVGQIRIYSYGSKYGTSKSNQFSYNVSNYVPFEISGFMDNVLFQHKDSLNIRPLTNGEMQIRSISYAKPVADLHKKHILIYSVYDRDTNRDGKIDASDIKALYISQANGKDFVKLTQELQELLDWTVIESQGKLFFRAIEDVNKNGAFDKDDAVRYYYVDLLNKEWKVQEYDPLGKKEKEVSPVQIEKDTLQ